MIDVLITGRDRPAMDAARGLFPDESRITVRERTLDASNPDPLPDGLPVPDLLVLVLNSQAHAELEALDRRPAHDRPATLVIGPKDDVGLMRLAMRAGARDFFFTPPEREEFMEAVQRVLEQTGGDATGAESRSALVINAKGGSGASFVATNLAHILAAHLKSRTALLDLDLQFGFLAANFSVEANDGLHQALESIDILDSVALEGWSVKHSSGVHIFGNTHRELILSRDYSEEQIGRFLDLLKQTYSQVLIDVPRQIDHLFAACVQRADVAVVVVQQSVAHLRDARTLLNILQRELLMRDEQIVVVVNRFNKNALISLKDIEKALRSPQVFTISNDYRTVAESLNAGVPLWELRPKASITQEMAALAAAVGGVASPKQGLLRRFFGSHGK